MDLFPGTTWTQVTDRFLYCANSSGTTGGNSTHDHGLESGYAKLGFGGTFGTGSGALTVFFERKSCTPYKYNCFLHVYDVPTASSLNGNAYSQDSVSRCVGLCGQTDSGSSMPPYVTVYCWRRTA